MGTIIKKYLSDNDIKQTLDVVLNYLSDDKLNKSFKLCLDNFEKDYVNTNLEDSNIIAKYRRSIINIFNEEFDNIHDLQKYYNKFYNSNKYDFKWQFGDVITIKKFNLSDLIDEIFNTLEEKDWGDEWEYFAKGIVNEYNISNTDQKLKWPWFFTNEEIDELYNESTEKWECEHCDASFKLNGKSLRKHLNNGCPIIEESKNEQKKMNEMIQDLSEKLKDNEIDKCDLKNLSVEIFKSMHYTIKSEKYFLSNLLESYKGSGFFNEFTVTMCNYSNSNLFFIGKAGKLIENCGGYRGDELNIPYEITQYLKNAYHKYRFFNYSDISCETICLRYDDEFIKKYIGNLDPNWNLKYKLYTKKSNSNLMKLSIESQKDEIFETLDLEEQLKWVTFEKVANKLDNDCILSIKQYFGDIIDRSYIYKIYQHTLEKKLKFKIKILTKKFSLFKECYNELEIHIPKFTNISYSSSEYCDTIKKQIFLEINCIESFRKKTLQLFKVYFKKLQNRCYINMKHQFKYNINYTNNEFEEICRDICNIYNPKFLNNNFNKLIESIKDEDTAQKQRIIDKACWSNDITVENWLQNGGSPDSLLLKQEIIDYPENNLCPVYDLL